MRDVLMLDFMLIDAFADAPFTGNPAAVVRGMPSEASMQNIAMEFNQAETAFVEPRDAGRFGLRWFTPRAEVALCGHATLAAARALFAWGDASGPRVVFETRTAGELSCERMSDTRLTLDFPATPSVPCPPPRDAARVLGVSGTVECVGTTQMNLLLVLDSEDQVRAAAPDVRLLATWHPVGVIVTAVGDDGASFVSRFFAPAVGIDEDPATGSAHCALMPYWHRRLGRTTMRARQLSRRGAVFDVELAGERVKMAGGTVITARGNVEAIAS